MSYDPHDTIVALASAPGGAARGIVRLSGPQVADCVASCFAADDDSESWQRGTAPRRVTGVIHISAGVESPALEISAALYYWPGEISFTRQPSAEIGCIGSPPLLAAIVEELCRHGARAAEPGEFTMRAFLAGRIDLTQAEAVLGVVDARSRDDLDEALARLAGGLSRPLADIREQLLATLAEVEAGLDFPDERLETTEREALRQRLANAQGVVAATLAQLEQRERADEVPRVLLTGPPNVGKSRLFNALVERYGVDRRVRSLVSPTPGATRDYVIAQLDLGGISCELIDVAGDDALAQATALVTIDNMAQHATTKQRRSAEIQLHCSEAGAALGDAQAGRSSARDLMVLTKCDLASKSEPGRPMPSTARTCSAVTGAGLAELAATIRDRLAAAAPAGATATAARCGSIIRDAAAALASAIELSGAGDDELLAAELRFALNAVGEVVGAVCADDVLDRVFSQFCIGK
jgi:tRNA modification GTPase